MQTQFAVRLACQETKGGHASMETSKVYKIQSGWWCALMFVMSRLVEVTRAAIVY